MIKNKESVLFRIKNALPVLLLIFIQCILIVYWGNQKNIGFVDEYFTLEGAAQGGAGMQYWDTHGEFYGLEHSHAEFNEFLTTHEEDLLINHGVSKIFNALVNCDFYYTCMNLAFSMFPGVLTKWTGIILNLLLFVGAQGLLYKISEVLSDRNTALLITGIYGFSAGAISTGTYIRCYMMLTLYALLVFAVQMYYARGSTYVQRILSILANLLLLVIGYKIHQFGVILYGLIIFFSMLNLLIKREKARFLWMIMGYLIPVIIAFPVVIGKAKSFVSGNVGEVFKNSLLNMNTETFILSLKSNTGFIINHLFSNIGIFFILCVLLLLIWKQNKEKKAFSKLNINDFEWLVWGTIIICYLLILVLGGAEAWRYVSPIYPFIVMFLVLYFRKINGIINVNDFNTLLFVGIFVVCSLTSWNDEHISDLYLDKDELQYQVNEEYEDVNGIMIHHGLSQNWLYEAASYWPEGSNVLVTTEAGLYDGSFDYARDDDRILLWLSIDYNNEEIIDLFKACTDYQKIRLAFTTDSLRVYECNKEG